MDLLDIQEYKKDIELVASLDLPWEMLNNSSILVSGATGLVGSFLVDVLMWKNINDNMRCQIYALGRNEERARKRFDKYLDSKSLTIVSCDINAADAYDILQKKVGRADYVVHLASNTHPVAYASDPIGTILTNILGTKALLDFSADNKSKRFAFASSNEIYGENRGDIEKFDENYCGYINSNTLRAGYPESKRCGEALCQAYNKQRGLDVVIPRITRSYGATLLGSDTKALSQFLKKAIAGEDIVLKSEGLQHYSYLYVADTVAGLLTVLLKGVCGEAYNISDESSDIRLKELASIVAKSVGKEVVFEIPDAVESAGFSKVTKALLDNSKIAKELGFKASYDIKTGIEKTVRIMKQLSESENY